MKRNLIIEFDSIKSEKDTIEKMKSLITVLSNKFEEEREKHNNLLKIN